MLAGRARTRSRPRSDAALRGEAIPVPADGTTSRGPVAPPPPVEARAPRGPQPRPRPARRQRAAWPWAILGAILLGGGAGGGYLLVQDLTKDTGGTDGTTAQIVRADDFDPLGGDGEHPDEVDRAIDDSTETGWSTETYSSQELGGKAGVGLYVVLSGVSEVSSVEVIADGSDWSAEIYVADTPAGSLEGWGSPVASGEGLGTIAVFDLDPARSAGAILLWITRVPESGRLDVLEVRVG